jgi:hypothetical protein
LHNAAFTDDALINATISFSRSPLDLDIRRMPTAIKTSDIRRAAVSQATIEKLLNPYYSISTPASALFKDGVRKSKRTLQWYFPRWRYYALSSSDGIFDTQNYEHKLQEIENANRSVEQALFFKLINQITGVSSRPTDLVRDIRTTDDEVLHKPDVVNKYIAHYLKTNEDRLSP